MAIPFPPDPPPGTIAGRVLNEIAPIGAAKAQGRANYLGSLAANQQRTQDAINAVSAAGGSAAFSSSISSKIGKRSGGGRRTRKGGSFRVRKPRVKGMPKIKGMRRSRSTRRKR